MSKIRVLVTDDSVVIRKLVSGVLNDDPGIEVVGTAVNGRASLQKIEQLDPDLVTMDVEMPEVDGIVGVRRIRAAGVTARARAAPTGWRPRRRVPAVAAPG